MPNREASSGHKSLRVIQRFTWIVIPLLALVAGYSSVQRFSRTSSLDFYHMWGIGTSLEITPQSPLNPYSAPDESARILNEYVDGLVDENLAQVNGLRRAIDPTGTPFFYASFSLLPINFRSAHIVFTVLQYALFSVGVMLLVRAAQIPWSIATIVTLAMLITFRPFGVDVRVGNVNSMQLFLLAGFAVFYTRMRSTAPLHYLLVVGLVTMTLWKPNIVPITGAFAIVLALQRGVRGVAVDMGVGLLTAGVIVVASSTWFGHSTIWLDWFDYLYANPAKLAGYTMTDGNLSFPLFLSNVIGAPTLFWVMGLVGLLAATAILALRVGGSNNGRSALSHLNVLSGDAWFVMSVGICATAAIAPLMWRHYFTWIAAAPLWMVCSRRQWDRVAILAAVALLLYWEPAGLVRALGAGTVNVLQASAWTLAWLSILVIISSGPTRATAKIKKR